jgi:hypothetical protein
MINTEMWKRVVFSFEFGDNDLCPECYAQDGECECPGPHSETEDGLPFVFKVTGGVMLARPPFGYDWDGVKLPETP